MNKTLKLGLTKIKEKKLLIIIPCVYMIMMTHLVKMAIDYIYSNNFLFSSEIFNITFSIFLIEIEIIGLLAILSVFSFWGRDKKTEDNLKKNKFVDKLGNAPLVFCVRKDNGVITREFYSESIAFSKYKACEDDIQTALNEEIIDIQRGKDMQHVLVKSTKKRVVGEDIIRWNDDLLSSEDFEIVLGKSDMGTKSINIIATPHILLGGGTGSGKSMLLKLILKQCIKKGAIVYLADFKGGIDYTGAWSDECTFVANLEDFDAILTKILGVMEERKVYLRDSRTRDISQYNKKTGANLKRLILACDEIAEILDKTGRDKDEKVLIGRIEAKLSTIARLGRAFGCHLILATQRPSTDIIRGEIKSNLNHRICGRADKVLSQIILDNSDAEEKIPPDAQGLFLTNSRVLFKAYYLEDDNL